MICRICGSKDIIQSKSGAYVCKLCKAFFGNDSIPKKCLRCGGTFVTLPVVEDTVLPLAFRTTSNIRTYWRKSQCPTCIVKSIRDNYVRRYGRDWNRPPLDWWGETEQVTISSLIKWGLDKGYMTRYELEHSRIPPRFIDFCLSEG